MRYNSPMRLFAALLTSLLVTASALANIPSIPGYKPGTLPHNLPLPIYVEGEGVSEQAVPVVLYLPTEGAVPISDARPSPTIPGLPATIDGYRLVVLKDAIPSVLPLKDGRSRQVMIPVLAYVPIEGQMAGKFDFERLLAQIDIAESAVPTAQPAFVRTRIERPTSKSRVLGARSPYAPQTHDKFTQTVADLASAQQTQQVVPNPISETIEAGKPAVESSAPTPTKLDETVADGTKKVVTWDDVLDEKFDWKSDMKVGGLILDERQSLRNRLPVHVDFPQRPLSEVLLSLANASGVDYSLGALPQGDPTVTARFTASPFAALEQIAKMYGVGIYHEPNEPLWVIRRVDPETLIARYYQLHEIHLGESSGSSGDKSFGSMDSSSSSSRMGTSSGSSRGGGSSSSASGYSLSGSTGNTGSSTSYNGARSNYDDPEQHFQERFNRPSDVLQTIRSILGLIEQAPMVSEINTDSDKPHVSTRPTGSKQSNGLVSYNAESNSIFVIASERQHEWVGEYVRRIDHPSVTIAIDALFIETDNNPRKQVGVDWSGTAVNWKLSTAKLDLGTLQKPRLPSGTILSGDALQASISAYVTESKSHVARYPRVVTSNNREVKISTTTNIPILTSASTVSNGVTTDNSSSTGTVQTNYSAGTQEVGTIITLLPAKISDDKIRLKISIEISSGGSSSSSGSSGESLTGRIPTTSTVYEGEVDIPAGRTLAIGGLERIADESGIGRLPGLSRIPVFGFLFKKRDADFRNTNITLFVTPRFLNDKELPTTSTRQSDVATRVLGQSSALEQKANNEAIKAEKAHK